MATLTLTIKAASVSRAPSPTGEVLTIIAEAPCATVPVPLAGKPASAVRPSSGGSGDGYQPTGLVGATFTIAVNDGTGAITGITWNG